MSEASLKERARAARDKQAPLGPDVDLGAYADRAKRRASLSTLGELSPEERARAEAVGLDAEESCRSGSFVQADHSVLLAGARWEGLEIMSIDEALERFGGLEPYWWRALPVDQDKYTAQAELKRTHGYFIRALSGARVEFPLQACLLMTEEGLAQNVHNVVVAEEGAELHVITGCATAQRVRSGLHVGVTEFYVKRNAHLTFTMIHHWAEDMDVRPRSAAVVEEGGVFLSNYVSMQPVRSLQMFPSAVCAGPGATVRFNSVLRAGEGTSLDVGARVVLAAPESRAEVISRAISTGGDITARGLLVGEAPRVKAHLECRGLILGERGVIHAVPELAGRVPDVDMSHEAAVGKIAEEEVRYLMARGLTGDEATAAIVRGFLDIEIKGLPAHLEDELKRAIRLGDEEERRL
jgi:Fe-S cluster assembly scaffold protein SufB